VIGGKAAPQGGLSILNARREKVQLVRLGFGALVDRRARAFVEIQRRRPGPPPVLLRDVASGLLHLVDREIVIRFKPETARKRRRDILKGFEVLRVNPFIPDQVVVHDPRRKHWGDDLVEVSNRWMELGEVVFATPNFVSQFLRQEPPFSRSEEWHLGDLQVAAAWKKALGDPNIVVAVLDDGVDVEHPNLAGNIWKNPDTNARDQIGRDFFVPADHPEHFNPRPKRFTFPFHLTAGNDIHGTPCAGLIAATGRNGGSVGVAPRCRILPVKIFHADGLAAGENVANAIRYAALHADILSCSWTGGLNPDIEQALADAGPLGRGGLGAAVFCAAGNGNGRPVGFPARDPNAIAVGAVTDQGKRAPYSNTGPQIALAAPSSGGSRGIFTTDVSLENRGFNVGAMEEGGEDGLHTNSFGGTSAAAALAAGVGALVLSVHPGLSRTDLRDLLVRTADPVGGSRRINASRAVAAAEVLSKGR
jgi:subtilisin family serine protease